MFKREKQSAQKYGLMVVTSTVEYASMLHADQTGDEHTNLTEKTLSLLAAWAVQQQRAYANMPW